MLLLYNKQTNKQTELTVYAPNGQPEIKKVLESVYSYEVEKVRTLNMKGKKKMRGGRLIAKPDYKKAYVTLKSPVSFSREFYPICLVEEERKSINKKTKSSTIKE
jgi:large subunit ribosomal protein L23